jgi:hypothetical protein
MIYIEMAWDNVHCSIWCWQCWSFGFIAVECASLVTLCQPSKRFLNVFWNENLSTLHNVNRIWRNLPYLFQNWEEWTSQQYVHLSLRVFMFKALFPYFRWWGLELKKRSSFQNQLNEACLNDIHASSECSSRRCGCYISCVCDCMVQHYKGFGYMIIKTRLIDWIISINWVDLIDV